MSLLQWNCNGLKTHFNDLKILIRNVNPFCIALQETNLLNSENRTLKNFKIYRKDSPNPNHGHHGVLLAVQESVYSEPISINTHLQAVAAKIHLKFTFSVCNIYLPQDRTIETQHLLDILNQLPRPVLLVGDLNGHSPLWGSRDLNMRGKVIESFIELSDLILLNTTQPTFLSSSYGTFSALDLSLCSPALYNNIDWTVLPDLHSSDHFPILIKFLALNPTHRVKPRWILDKADWLQFTSLATPPENSPCDLTIEEGCQAITGSIIQAAQAAIPMTSGFPKRPAVPWFNDACKQALRNRRKAYKKFHRCMTSDNLIEYKKQKAICRMTFNHYKIESWKKFVNGINSSTSSSTVWKNIRKISSKSSLYRFTILTNDQLSDDPLIVSNTFADHYSQTYNSRENNLNLNSEKTEDQNSTVDTNYYNIPFTTWELNYILDNVKGSSPGPDNIHYEMLIKLPKNTKEWLLAYYNHIWQSGILPNTWKNSIVIPIFKTGKDKLDPSSYRPIFLTSCLCKVMERMVNKRLMWVLEKHNFIQPFQSGFRKGRSTIDHLLTLDTEAQYAFINGQQMIAVFFDMQKAFDNINHAVILHKLLSIGIQGQMFSFVKQFLRNRHFRVRIGCEYSQYHRQKNGVPQGCVLSPTLFLLAVNDLGLNLPRGVKPLLFADDLAILYRSESIQDIQLKLQETLNRIKQWSNTIGIQFSTEKSKCLHFNRKRNTPPSPELFLGNSPIPYATHHRFLGLTFDKRLNWEQHISYLKTIATKKLNIIRVLSNTKWGADRTSLLKIYQTLIRSKIDYGSFIYSSARFHVLTKLDTVHHTGIRIATGAFRTSPTLSLCSESGLSPLLFRRLKLAINYVSKIHSQTGHPTYKYIFNSKYSNSFRQKQNSTLPLPERIPSAISFLKTIKISLSGNDIPPWTHQRPNTILDLTKFSKQNTEPSKFKDIFSRHINDTPESFIIYTDGSKSDRSASSAFVTKDSTHKIKLHKLSNIYTAELNAIAAALHFCMTLTYNSIIIATDSLSSLKGMDCMYPEHPKIPVIHSYLSTLKALGKTVKFIWIPSHVGIVGNELADLAAREALELPGRGKNTLTPSDLRKALEKEIGDGWQSMWDESPPSKLKMIKKNVKPWNTSSRQSRREEVVLTRLRIGHTRLTHSYLFTRGAPPRCKYCGDILTVIHIFRECPFFTSHLNSLGLNTDLPTILGDNNEKIKLVFKFLKLSGLLTEI